MQTSSLCFCLALLTCFLVTSADLRAVKLLASDGVIENAFGYSVSLSGNIALVGGPENDDRGIDSGVVYAYLNLDTASGAVNENAKLLPSRSAAYDYFGSSLSVFGNTAIVGAASDDDNGSASGSVYLFRNMESVAGTVNENAKLLASDGATGDWFGFALSLHENTALVGAYHNDDNGSSSGSAYVYRNLNLASGVVIENVKLIASDAASGDVFGYSTSQSGNFSLVGAPYNDDGGTSSGSAYVFRGVDVSTGTVTENVKLTASDQDSGDRFGWSVSQSGKSALIGAPSNNDGGITGAAYLYRNLDTATGTVEEDVMLLAAEPKAGQSGGQFGQSVSLSGSAALVAASFSDNNSISFSGSVFVFQNLDTASGTVTANIKLLASDAAWGDRFGFSVFLESDNFIIGTYPDQKVGDTGIGKAYTGSISSMTCLDAGNSDTGIDGISFVSQDDWIIGENTDENRITLGLGDSADVSVLGKRVYIGKNEESDNNTLSVSGTLVASSIYVGSNGNAGNLLEITASGSVSADYLDISSGSSVSGNITVTSEGSISGNGVISGNLKMEPGAVFDFDADNTLTVTGLVLLDSSFGIDDLNGIDSSLAAGTYTLIDGTSTDFSSLGIDNWGLENAYDLGDAKLAYFSSGSLQVTIVDSYALALKQYLSYRSLGSSDLEVDTNGNGYSVLEEYLAGYGDGSGADLLFFCMNPGFSAINLTCDSHTQPEGIIVELLATSDLAVGFTNVDYTLTEIDNQDGSFTLIYAEDDPPDTDNRFLSLRISAVSSRNLKDTH